MHTRNHARHSTILRSACRRALGLLPLLPLLQPLAAAAQPAQSTSGETIESIVVTARIREENLQDTPVAVTALTADALDRQQIQATTDLVRRVVKVMLVLLLRANLQKAEVDQPFQEGSRQDVRLISP